MSPDRLHEVLALLRWSQRGLANALDCDDRMVRWWGAGHGEIPADVASWLETLARAHEDAPPPTTWRRRRRPVPAAE